MYVCMLPQKESKEIQLNLRVDTFAPLSFFEFLLSIQSTKQSLKLCSRLLSEHPIDPFFTNLVEAPVSLFA